MSAFDLNEVVCGLGTLDVSFGDMVTITVASLTLTTTATAEGEYHLGYVYSNAIYTKTDMKLWPVRSRSHRQRCSSTWRPTSPT